MTKKKKSAKKTKEKKSIVFASEKPEPAPGPVSPVTPYPTAGPKITEFENVLDSQLAGGGEQPEKRGRGRPRKDQAPISEPENILDERIISQALQVPFDLWASTNKLPALKLSVQDSQLLSKPVKQLLDYYLPKVPAITIAWIALAVTSWSVMSVRLTLIARIKKEKAQSPSSATGPAPGNNQGRDVVANPERNVNAPAPVVFPPAGKPVQL